ncbi:hypothetical protein GPL17_34050 [Bradyrhizobium yuanmingense]|uniref:hypothetical protein n=1 Tax=Bradyrhizobium yuanmingense TaxID=108015 RepID=UPI0012F9D3D9|nr:hypothetical protein [Bradyrhizobium yuanmingense]MVT55455.1 hypothetical protein [Bradyrhizobium yuanmingense]
MSGPEDIVAFAADHLTNQLPAMFSLNHELLNRPLFDSAKIVALVFATVLTAGARPR